MRLLSIIFAFITSIAHADEFRDDFNFLDESVWMVSDWQAPGGNQDHHGVSVYSNAEVVDGYLRLQLFQFETIDGDVRSFGGEIATREPFGYGTYEFRMRASTTSSTPYGEGESLSGAVSGAFLYARDADTEIDVEFESNERNHITHLISWKDGRRNDWSPVDLAGAPPHEGFYVYRFEWTPTEIRYYRDNILIDTHYGDIPSIHGHMMFNHWGSHNSYWGGEATFGTVRYLYVDYFQFTPLEG